MRVLGQQSIKSFKAVPNICLSSSKIRLIKGVKEEEEKVKPRTTNRENSPGVN